MKRHCSLSWLVASLALFITLILIAATLSAKGRARQTAEGFFGQALTQHFPYMSSSLRLSALVANEPTALKPRWVLRYGTAFTEGYELEVTFFGGEVVACNVDALDRLVGLPEKDRMRGVANFIESRSSSPNPTDPDRVKPNN